MRTCGRCNGERVLIHGDGDFARAEACSCQPPCTKCGGQGVVFFRDAIGYLVATPCECSSFLKCVEWFNRAQIPSQAANATLDSFRPKFRSDPAAGQIFQAQKNLLEVSRRFVDEYERGGRGLLFYGPCGTGKTHLAVAILRSLILRRGIQGRFVDFTHLLSSLRAAYADNESAERILTPLIDVPILVLDELGKNRGTDWERDVLDELISKRYNGERTTIFTTNLFPRPTTPGQETLRDRLGERIYSRLNSMCTFIETVGDDYRRAD